MPHHYNPIARHPTTPQAQITTNPPKALTKPTIQKKRLNKRFHYVMPAKASTEHHKCSRSTEAHQWHPNYIPTCKPKTVAQRRINVIDSLLQFCPFEKVQIQADVS